ncbi:MAG TPA: hypothetical protein VK403_05565 [Allosphingosinicella sp.]|nr:hypothetical protein [Allosphingosinicella sp.]
MKAISKTMLGAGVSALAALSFAAPADAQYRDRYRDRGGIDTSDIITGVAILGAISAVTSALNRDGSRYGYGYRDRYRDGYNYAVQSCAREAQRMARGRVEIVDVDRVGSDRYRVRGVVQAGYGGYDRGYDSRYDRGYNRGYNRGYDSRYDRGYDRGYDSRYDRGYGAYGRGYGRDDFTCVARGNGRITDFRL